jgi:hypothetical protein
LEFSVDPRLLLAVLQYRSQWLTQSQIDDNLKLFPIQGKPSPDGFDRSGLYKQLSWAANQLNAGYYGWKYKGADTLEFDDGTRLRYATDLNAGTIGVQFMFSLQSEYSSWENAVGSEGLFKIYTSFFGDPLVGSTDSVIPQGLQQPELALPFAPGQIWFFTGGPHGGWGGAVHGQQSTLHHLMIVLTVVLRATSRSSGQPLLHRESLLVAVMEL